MPQPHAVLLFLIMHLTAAQPNNLVGLTEMEHHHGPRRRGQKACEIPLKEWMINRLRENRE